MEKKSFVVTRINITNVIERVKYMRPMVAMECNPVANSSTGQHEFVFDVVEMRRMAKAWPDAAKITRITETKEFIIKNTYRTQAYFATTENGALQVQTGVNRLAAAVYAWLVAGGENARGLHEALMEFNKSAILLNNLTDKRINIHFKPIHTQAELLPIRTRHNGYYSLTGKEVEAAFKDADEPDSHIVSISYNVIDN